MAVAPTISYGKINATEIKASIGRFNKTYHERMKRLMRGGVRAFVKAAVEQIHIDSGMSGASLQPLAKAVGTGILGSLGGSPRKGLTSMSGRYYRNRQRSIDEGIKAGMNAYKINYGTVKRPMMFLRFETNVYQYALWEGELWDSIIPGVNAMVDYIYENYTRYFPDAEFADLLDLNKIWDIK